MRCTGEVAGSIGILLRCTGEVAGIIGIPLHWTGEAAGSIGIPLGCTGAVAGIFVIPASAAVGIVAIGALTTFGMISLGMAICIDGVLMVQHLFGTKLIVGSRRGVKSEKKFNKDRINTGLKNLVRSMGQM